MESSALATIEPQVLADVREWLKQEQTSVQQSVKDLPPSDGFSVVEAITNLVDQCVVRVARAAVEAVDAAARSASDDVMLVALGSYGRRELCPFSDVDILFLLSGRPDVRPAEARYVNAVLYGLWDLGFEVGQAVRTVSESVDQARADQSVLSSLLDARLVYGPGDRSTVQALDEAVDRLLFRGAAASDLIYAKIEEADRRDDRFGRTLYLLEPNVKESPGALRELHTARWIAQARWRARSIDELRRKGVIAERESQTMQRAYGFLLRVRSEVHWAAGRRQDHLQFRFQEMLAASLSYRSERAGSIRAGTERFMRAYYFHAHALRHHTKLIVERATKHRSRRAPTLRPARNGFRLWNGMLTVASRDHFTKDPASLIRIFRIAREESIEVYSYSKNLVALSRAAIDREARRSPAVVDEFLRLLESTSDDGRMLIALHQLGILAQIMPEWRRVIARWQHSMYHVYTVDAHSLEVLRNLKRLRIGTLMEQQPALTRLMVDVPRPTVVYMAALLHDIGKGWPSGDHSERGARVAKVVGERFEQAQLPRWTKQETDDLIWLVRHHLTMSDIAQRRDVSDSDLVAKFADEVDTIERLTMLYLLTFADMKGTSPKVWTDWKASLLRELYENTWTVMAAVKSGTIPSMEERRRRASAELLAAAAQTDRRVDAALVDAFTAAMPGRYLSSFTDRQMIRHVQMWRDVSRRGGLAVHIRQLRREDTTRLTIVGKDYPGLLAEVSGVLAGYGIDILSASIFSLAVYQRATEIMGPTGDLPYQHLGRRDHPRPNRIALDVLYVKDDSGRIADDSKKWNRIRSALEATVLERRGVESALRARRASGLDVPHRPRVNARVDVSNRDSRTETVIDIFGQNHIGALHTIAQKLTKLGLTISLAKISTQGDRLADGFYVTDTATGDQLKDSHRIRDLKRALIDALQMAAD